MIRTTKQKSSALIFFVCFLVVVNVFVITRPYEVVLSDSSINNHTLSPKKTPPSSDRTVPHLQHEDVVALETVRYPFQKMLCSPLLQDSSRFEDAAYQASLRKTFDRFKAVPDSREGDETPRTAEVRFVAALNTLQYRILPPFIISALVAGTPIEFIGVDDPGLNNPYPKFQVLESFVQQNAHLKDSDVVVLVDADVTFTGRDFMPFIESFLSSTARDRSELDARKVRAHQQRAPFLTSSQRQCYLAVVMGYDECALRFQYLDEQQGKWAAEFNEYTSTTDGRGKPWVFENNNLYSRNARPHVNGGGTVARVWALREVTAAMSRFIYTRFSSFPLTNFRTQSWQDDQSVMGTLISELMLWEFKAGNLSMIPKKRDLPAALRHPPFDMTPGVMGFDIQNDFLISLYVYKPAPAYLNGHPMNYSRTGKDYVVEVSALVIAEYINNSTVAVKDGSTTRYVPKVPLATSPTGVPLAPVEFAVDLRSNGNKYYRNWPLDGSQGAIDVSIPHPSGIPLGLHYNHYTKASCREYQRLLSWVVPLYAEGSTEAPPDKMDASNLPQATALLRLLANAPPISLWRYKGEVPDAIPVNGYKERLPMEHDTLNIRTLCQMHAGSTHCE